MSKFIYYCLFLSTLVEIIIVQQVKRVNFTIIRLFKKIYTGKREFL